MRLAGLEAARCIQPEIAKERRYVYHVHLLLRGVKAQVHIGSTRSAGPVADRTVGVYIGAGAGGYGRFFVVVLGQARQRVGWGDILCKETDMPKRAQLVVGGLCVGVRAV